MTTDSSNYLTWLNFEAVVYLFTSRVCSLQVWVFNGQRAHALGRYVLVCETNVNSAPPSMKVIMMCMRTNCSFHGLETIFAHFRTATNNFYIFPLDAVITCQIEITFDFIFKGLVELSSLISENDPSHLYSWDIHG